MSAHVFFFIDGCGYCERILPEIVDFYTRTNIQLVIRKPTMVEKDAIPGYPALLIPGRVGSRPLLLVGTNILGALHRDPELLNGSVGNHLANPAPSDGDAGV